MKRILNIKYTLAAAVCMVATQGAFAAEESKVPANSFPLSLQYFEIAPGKTFDKSTVYDILKHGVTNMWIRDCKSEQSLEIIKYFQSKGMKIDFMTHGNENFIRDEAPVISVYDPAYVDAVRKNVEHGLAQVKDLPQIDYVYPYIDEPFHRKPCLDYSLPTQQEFKRRYGYAMPLSFEDAMRSPKVQLDFLNFQSDIFRDGWLKTQKIVKEYDPRVKIAMTHDSHNCYGGGVKSNSQMAMDDVFHWGGDYADLFVYDIYPYLTFDYRYGETGVYRKPRVSQMHYTMAQLRNMTQAYKKTMGFWVGTYNEAWFVRFRGPERAKQFWSEREILYTAIANGSDYIISPSDYMGHNIPVDKNHWDEYGKGMEVIQKAGKDIVKAPKVKANACFIFPRTQYLLLQEEYYNVGLSYELFLRAFGELDIIHEEQITDDKLNGYKALVMCDVKLLPQSVATHIENFVKKGGVVIADCVPQMNENREELKTMASLFGVSEAQTDRIVRSGQWVPFVNLSSKFSFPPVSGVTDSEPVFDRVDARAYGDQFGFRVVSPRKCEVTDAVQVLGAASGQPALISRKVGDGHTYLFGFCLQDTYFHACKIEDQQSNESLYRLVGSVFGDAGVTSHVHSSNPDIEAGVRANSANGYVFVINHESQNPATTVTLAEMPSAVSRIMDVETGKAIKFTVESGKVKFSADVPWGKTKLMKLIF